MILSSSILNADTETKKDKSMLDVYNVMLWRHKLLDLDGDMVKAEVPETYKVNTYESLIDALHSQLVILYIVQKLSKIYWWINPKSLMCNTLIKMNP